MQVSTNVKENKRVSDYNSANRGYGQYLMELFENQKQFDNIVKNIGKTLVPFRVQD